MLIFGWPNKYPKEYTIPRTGPISWYNYFRVKAHQLVQQTFHTNPNFTQSNPNPSTKRTQILLVTPKLNTQFVL